MRVVKDGGMLVGTPIDHLDDTVDGYLQVTYS